MHLLRWRRRDGAQRQRQRFRSALAPARAMERAGRHAEAEAEARSVAAARARRRDKVGSALALHVAANAMNSQGRHAEALTEYDAVLPVFVEAFGADDFDTLNLRVQRAHALALVARHAEAETECAAVVRTVDRGRGVDPRLSILAGTARHGLIQVLNGQERFAEAEALACKTLALRAFKYGPLADLRVTGELQGVLRLGLARSLNGQRRYAEALTEVTHAKELRRNLPDGPDNAGSGAAELIEATALLGLGCKSVARARATAAYDAALAAFGMHHFRVAAARALLGRIDDGDGHDVES
ncbi:tetratricopeptide repeat protein [Streptomyces sp. NPDC018019]|uniref:tetratricopeptide repeat protein n=1 Tax=Streptomyces sp. NPDC018019 TaxID=3365030 RepID=UPI00379C8B30